MSTPTKYYLISGKYIKSTAKAFFIAITDQDGYEQARKWFPHSQAFLIGEGIDISDKRPVMDLDYQEPITIACPKWIIDKENLGSLVKDSDSDSDSDSDEEYKLGATSNTTRDEELDAQYGRGEEDDGWDF